MVITEYMLDVTLSVTSSITQNTYLRTRRLANLAFLSVVEKDKLRKIINNKDIFLEHLIKVFPEKYTFKQHYLCAKLLVKYLFIIIIIIHYSTFFVVC